MEVYLVKNYIKVTKVTEAFSETKQVNDHFENLLKKAKRPYGAAAASSSSSQDDDDAPRKLLTVSNLPVAIQSICSDDDTWQSKRFAERVDFMLKTKTEEVFGNLKVELVIFKDEGDLKGYFMVSPQMVPPARSKVSLFTRLNEKLDHLDRMFSVDLFLIHMSTKNEPIPNDAVRLHLEGNVESYFPVEIPPELKQWWEKGTGFILSRTCVQLTLFPGAVNCVYGLPCRVGNIVQRGYPNTEILCRDGEIVACHRETLVEKSAVLQAKFEEMESVRLEAGEQVEPGTLMYVKMRMDLRKEGVEALLEWSYGNGVCKGDWLCGVTLDLFKAGREYGIWKLEETMGEMLMGRRSTDFEFFGVGSALELFLYARENGMELKHLRDKAVRVLFNFVKNASEKIGKSKDYQDLLRKKPEVAAELKELYNKLG